jgi:carbon-monoxide dehydrogenase large subunit
MAGSILGTRVLRTEDPDLLTGAVRYLADLDLGDLGLGNTLHAVFVRSESAHALIEGIDLAGALAAPGVVGVFTAADLGLPGFHGMAKVDDVFARPPLAVDRVRFVGEAVAVVVAHSALAARDAADQVVVHLQALEAAVLPEDALAAGAPALFDERPDNVALSTTEAVEPRAPADAVFGDADVVVRARLVNQRMAVAPIEPHAAAAAVQADGRLLVYGSTQMPHLLRQLLAAGLGVGADRVRVVTPPVGGGFGGKAGLYPEQLVVAALAMRLGAPVVWVATRSEDMLCLAHSRAQVQYAELGCRRDGTFTGLRVRLVGDGGAYPGLGAI